MDPALQAQLRQLPAVGELLQEAALQPSLELPRWALLEAAREVVEALRMSLRRGEAPPSRGETVNRVQDRARRLARPRLRRVINASGTVVHTNLGRAPLSVRAQAALQAVSAGYSNLEYDLEQGSRGSRHGLVDPALCRLTGAEAAMVVNNNAAAVLLALSSLAAGKEVVVSRGELVEIGGSFRIPDILLQSGCILKEVGTTNRTRLSDYEAALSERTGLLLKVHPSNYRVIGFTESVDLEALVALGRRRGVPVVEDLGSGCLSDLSDAGLGGEPTARERLASGLDLVTMSGDKLLGGPQAGILLGKKAIIARCRAHPLARALRVDKLCLAALEATLQSWLEHREREELPVVRALTRPLSQLKTEAEALAQGITDRLPGLTADVWADASNVGGGAFPEQPLPTWVVALRPPDGASALERWLRQGDPAIVSRVRQDALLLDPRTLLPGEDLEIMDCLARWWREEKGPERPGEER